MPAKRAAQPITIATYSCAKVCLVYWFVVLDPRANSIHQRSCVNHFAVQTRNGVPKAYTVAKWLGPTSVIGETKLD